MDKLSSGLLVSLLALLCAGLQPVSGANTRVCSPLDSRPHPQGICGENVPEMLKLVCGSDGYIERTYKKRSPAEIDIADLPASALLEYSKSVNDKSEDSENKDHTADTKDATGSDHLGALSNVLYDKRTANGFLQKRIPYYMSGISCECCYHVCSIRELSQYCKNEKKAMLRLRMFG